MPVPIKRQRVFFQPTAKFASIYECCARALQNFSQSRNCADTKDTFKFISTHFGHQLIIPFNVEIYFPNFMPVLSLRGLFNRES